jgi:tetratricopeptide (TPR) repeat protein
MFRMKSAAIVPLAALVAALILAPGAIGAQPDEDLEFQPEEVERVPPSKELERAIKLYEKGDYYSASIEFKKVLSGTSDSQANKERAQFFLGKTLYQMGYYAAALAYFDQIVSPEAAEAAGAPSPGGPGHRYYGPTLKWLAALSRVLPETSGILDKIGRYDPADLEQTLFDEVRDELYYLLGRHYYRQGGEGDFDTAIDLFQRVTTTSPFYVKAKFFEGVTYVRKFQGAPAVNAFKDLLVIAEERPAYYESAEIDQFRELAWLQMARIFYSTQQYDLSIKYYELLEPESPDWLPSLFEASWAYFMKTNNSKALGNIHTLNAPYFEDEFFPESILLKSVIYYKYCLYERALEAVAEYDAKYRPLRDNLNAILEKHEDNTKFYDYVIQIMEGKAGLDDETNRLVLTALGDRTLAKTFNWVEELQREVQMYQKADASWKTVNVGQEIFAELTLQESLAKADAGRLARERIERLSDELRKLSRDGLKVKIEVLNSKAGQISAEARGEQISGEHKEEPIIIDDEHFMWKFNGEYWKDELGYYRFRIRSQCPK